MFKLFYYIQIYFFIQEKTAVLQSLKERALLVEKTFNSMKGFKCNVVAGAMYAFPKLTLPQKAIEKAKVMHIQLLIKKKF